MNEFDEVVDLDDVNEGFSVIFFIMLFFSGVLIFLVVVLDQRVMQTNQTQFQNALSSGLTAYSTSYSTNPEHLKQLSEGYLTNEDISIYSVDSNAVPLDRTLASDYFYKVIEASSPQTKKMLQSCGVYIIDITTKFKNSGQTVVPKYIVSIYKDGDVAQQIDVNCNTLEEVQNLVESTLDVKIDIATNYNSSLREAQKYKREDSTTGGANKQNTYSTYSTSMAIIKNVPINNMFGTKLVDIKEIQTYSVIRGGKVR